MFSSFYRRNILWNLTITILARYFAEEKPFICKGEKNIINKELKEGLKKGELPSPEMLARYKEIYPEAPEIILREYEERGKHARTCETLKIEGKIAHKRHNQYMAFILCVLIVLAVSFYFLA